MLKRSISFSYSYAVPLLDYTIEQVRKLKLNPNCEEFAAPKDKIRKTSIPTLREVLENLKKGKMIVKIELKGKGAALPSLKLVEELGMVDRVHFR